MPTFANSKTVRERIIENIVSTLQGITVANGYHVDIVSVQRQEPGGAVRKSTPFILVQEGGEEAKDGPNPMSTKMLDIVVTAVTSRDEDYSAPLDETLNVLRGDVETALMQDRTRGNLAVLTSPVGSMPAEYHDKGGVASPGVAILFSVTYRHHYQDPTLKM